MISYRKTLVTCLLISSLAVAPLSALAAAAESSPGVEPRSSEAMTVDAVIARPIGLVATLFGAVVFVVSLPFSALGGNSEEAWNALVADPAVHTFQRPLGEYE